jgi:hypothetical protein
MPVDKASYRLGYQQAQLDVLRKLFVGNNLYLTDNSMKIARAVLGLEGHPIADEDKPIAPELPPLDDDDIPF